MPQASLRSHSSVPSVCLPLVPAHPQLQRIATWPPYSRHGGSSQWLRTRIIRSYDEFLDRTVSTSRRFLIGSTISDLPLKPVSNSPHNLRKDEDEGGGYVDNPAHDELERICLEVDAPGLSLHPANSDEPRHQAGRRLKVEVRDCQWWVRQ